MKSSIRKEVKEMKRKQIVWLYSSAIDILEALKMELDRREDGWDTLHRAILDLCQIHDWYLNLEDWE